VLSSLGLNPTPTIPNPNISRVQLLFLGSRRQLALSLAREVPQQTPEHIREELLKALADLLLEALGEEEDKQVSEPANEQGVAHESEDYL
jgi:hypothetical protein